ncbi:MAG: hypothetical protein JXB03_06785 [Spirochaetales bacterium]|nr:hypothetical protein [Spirochaetales bacterium]
MKKPKVFKYVIDSLTPEKAEKLKIALESVDSIKGIRISTVTGILEVQALRNVYDEICIATKFSGVTIRTEVKKRTIFG